jgi:hypothetical protein
MVKIRDEVARLTDALHVRMKNHTLPAEAANDPDQRDDLDRGELERRVIEGLVIRDSRFASKAKDVSEAVIGAKTMALSDEPPEKIADFIGLKAL